MTSMGEVVLYLVQTKEQRELSSGAKWDIISRFARLEKRIHELESSNYEKYVNELKIELNKLIKWKDPLYKDAYQHVLWLIEHMLNGEYIRNTRRNNMRYSKVKSVLKYLNLRGFQKVKGMGLYEKKYLQNGHYLIQTISAHIVLDFRGDLKEMIDYHDVQAYAQLEVYAGRLNDGYHQTEKTLEQILN